MLAQILTLIIDTLGTLLVYVLLLRFHMQWLRAPFRNPAGELGSGLTNWCVLPARRVVPGLLGLDFATLMLAIDAAETQRGKAALRRASAIDPSWLLEEFTDQIDDVDELVWNRARTRVERTRAMRYGGLEIEASPAPVEDLAAAGVILAREAQAAGIGAFLDEEELATWRRRVTIVAEGTPGLDLRPLDDAQLAAKIGEACAGLTSFAELRSAGLLDLLGASLGPARRTVDERAPTHVRLRGRQVRVNYPADGSPPWIASRMQDFFGLARGPAILGGQLPLVLHLLAPNQRAVQVTQDLPGFWSKHYPGLRNALARRYPRHVWPEDPLTLSRDD